MLLDEIPARVRLLYDYSLNSKRPRAAGTPSMCTVRKQFEHYPTTQLNTLQQYAPPTAEMHSYSSSVGSDMQRGALMMVLRKVPSSVRLLLYDCIFKFNQQLLPPSNLYKSVNYWCGRTLALR